jgi:hypothetical protein
MSGAETGQVAGLIFLRGEEVQSMMNAADAFTTFANSWNTMRPDPYLGDDPPFRFRRHTRCVLGPGPGLTVLPHDDYLQSAEHNPLFGGISRRFDPIVWDDAATLFLTELARLGVTEILRIPGPVLINMHQIRIVGGKGEAGTPVPEGPHRDGYDFISIHLVGRDVDGGGETTVTADEDGIRTTLTLAGPLDSVYLDDRAYTHYTTPIRGEGRAVHRDVLLMSFEQADG